MARFFTFYIVLVIIILHVINWTLNSLNELLMILDTEIEVEGKIFFLINELIDSRCNVFVDDVTIFEFV